MKGQTVFVCVIDGEYATTATVHLTRWGALHAANDPGVFRCGNDEPLDFNKISAPAGELESVVEAALTEWYEENGSGSQYFEIIETTIEE